MNAVKFYDPTTVQAALLEPLEVDIAEAPPWRTDTVVDEVCHLLARVLLRLKSVEAKRTLSAGEEAS